MLWALRLLSDHRLSDRLFSDRTYPDFSINPNNSIDIYTNSDQGTTLWMVNSMNWLGFLLWSGNMYITFPSKQLGLSKEILRKIVVCGIFLTFNSKEKL